MITQRKDGYGFRQGVAFAREMIESCRGDLTLAPILQNLRRAMGNKPPAQAEGIKSIIDVLENARDIQALRGKV